MATYVDWPRSLFVPKTVKSGYTPQSANSSQLSISGRLNNGGIPGRGIWKPSLVEVAISRHNRNSWLALEGQIRGRVKPVMVPYYPADFYPKFGDPSSDATFSDSATFSDGSTFVSTGTHVLVSTYADAGDVSISVNKIECGTIQTGHVFEVDMHQYKVVEVTDQDETTATFEITPELRTDIYPRDEVDFVYPRVKCRLIDPAAMNVELEINQFSFPTIDFIEDTAPEIL